MKRIDLVLFSDKLVVNPSSRAPAGYWISHGPWLRIGLDSDPAAIAKAVRSSLAESQTDGVLPADLKALTKERFAAAGVRSERAYMTGSSMLALRWEDQHYLLTPQANGGTSGDKKGFTALVSRRVELPDNLPANELGVAVIRAFEFCEPQPNNSFKPTPLRGAA